ncbi:nicotinate-nucleotide--dimethylbenzimidazole phosphoribosyltransferase [Oceanicoccus sp. KOV_DT_Chl]|uniref:nicotinate-nucleotide--dimethylbenzimidazole phosphoribosyltransferase n=1 Tax=Oceanicoccus sp. KOV_DT_Chl TaxID=1904639 RepID=UPI000C7CE38D|nr:nicotinate-nucleotide--dimethylbenzimidazole phosphoribosyltransferase [Oceanicoccus sp. KOV_DT_Chl]
MDNTLDWLQAAVKSPCQQALQGALAQQQQLTKPPGSLGQLEQLATTLASLQHTNTPQIELITIVIFAADHGIAAQGVSAFPQAVTAEMVKNFASGGAAISVLAKQLQATLQVCNVGTVAELTPNVGVLDCRLGAGTHDFSQQAAMSESQLQQALAIGKQQVDMAHTSGCDLFIGGEMGIANTSSASALACALLQLPASTLTGPGTGIDSQTMQHKQAVIEQALQLHHLTQTSPPLDCLRLVGGFEIAALVGAYLRAAQLGIPVLIDGFIASVAALAAQQFQPKIAPWLLLGHQSAEPGHSVIVKALDKTPLLQLQMRLGEGSGAACAVPLLQLACALHNQMATFASAGVSTQ